MPETKLVQESVSGKYRILVTNSQSKLSREIIRQLEGHAQIEIVHLLDKIELSAANDIDVILHVVSLESTSLSHATSFTTYLLSLLDIARDCRAKYFLITPQSPSDLIKKSVTLITQFSKVNSLNYQVIEIVEDDVFLEAEAIIRKVIRNHRAPATPVVPPKLKTLSHPAPTIPKITKEKTQLVDHKSRAKFFSKSNVKYPVLIALVVILFPWVMTLVQALSLPILLNCSLTSLKSGQINQSRTCAKITSHLTQSMATTARVSLFSPQVFELAGLPLEFLVSTLLHMSSSLDLAADLTQAYTSAFNGFLGETDSVEPLDIPPLTYKLISLSEQLAYLQSDMRDLYLSSHSPPKFINPLAAQVSAAQTLVSKVQKVTPDLPLLLSYHQKTSYLVLIQDNTELRPTGGFIDSFMLITAENGLISDIQLFSTSLADARLKGQVEPPSDLKTILGENSWYLRDSNWDPDFSISAQKASWFVEKELSRPVDVVVALNWTAVQSALDLIGPLSLSESGTKFNSSNVLSEYLAHIEPSGASSDQSLIAKLVQKIVDSSKKLSNSQMTGALLKLLDLADTRQLLISPVTFKTNSLKVAGWSGEIAPAQCLSQNLCFQDYFYIVHTNVGINKSDYYISPQTKVSIDLKPERVSYLLNLSLKNSSPQSSWPTGKYRDYIRIYLPQNTNVDNVKVNGQALHLGQYSVTFNSGLPVLSLLVEVLPSQATDILVTAHKNVNLSDVFHYQLNIPNQPGLIKNPSTLNITFPADWPATVYSQPSVASGGQLQYNVAGDEITQIDVDFSANK